MKGIIRMLLECTEKDGGRTFSVRAVKKWNMLDVDLKQSRSAKTFKRSLFKSILDNQMLENSLNVNYFDIVFNNF